MRILDKPLIGRDRDLAVIAAFIDEATAQGAALLLAGEPGVGKTALLDVAAAHAFKDGHRVLRVTGAEFEATLSFAGLNQLVYPLLEQLDHLNSAQRDALSVAIGLTSGTLSDHMLVANAALALLRSAAAACPILAVVDDVQWVDRASAAVLGFVARRLAGSPIALLMALRTGEDTFLDRGGLFRHDLLPLDEVAAATLLDDRYPALAPRVRQRLLNDAEGNPLALLELPISLAGAERATAPLPSVLPLTRRLQTVFMSRVQHLPPETRQALLLAVLDGTRELGVVLQTADSSKRPLLASAEHAKLVLVDEASRRLEFRHPLIRSAIVELSTSDERREVHQRLAEYYVQNPERQAWHLAEASAGPNEEVAALLQEVAHTHLRRGDAVGAIAELVRSAALSPDATDRGIRLAEAAYLGATVNGDLRDVSGLLQAVREVDPEHGGSLAGAVAAAYQLLNGDGDVDTAHRLLVDAIDALPDSRDAHNKTLHEALYSLLVVSFFGGRAELWGSVHATVDRLAPRPPALLNILTRTFGDPVRLAVPVLEQLDAEIPSLANETSPARIVRVGIAAAYVDRLSSCRGVLRRVVEHGRGGGAVTSAIEALFLLGNDAFFSGQWDELEGLLDEGLALCSAHGYRLLAWPGVFLSALLAAARGDADRTLALTDDMVRWAEPRRVKSVQYYAAHTRALAALGQGDYEAAYRYASFVSAAGVLESHVPHALWLVFDLIEAAIRSGRLADARAHVAAARAARIDAISPRLALVVRGAAAMASAEDDFVDHFEAALGVPDANQWPFDCARIELTYGERLRRTKATVEARAHLSTALSTFERLAAKPWMARASSELRATGLPSASPSRLSTVSLTPQQREIALLAATGLSNKKIGERLFLSPRTVATHLYQLFPKLGVTSRAALRDALDDRIPESDQV